MCIQLRQLDGLADQDVDPCNQAEGNESNCAPDGSSNGPGQDEVPLAVNIICPWLSQNVWCQCMEMLR